MVDRLAAVALGALEVLAPSAPALSPAALCFFAVLSISTRGAASPWAMTARALLNESADPTPAEAKEALACNICRCNCYPAIAQATPRGPEDEEEGR